MKHHYRGLLAAMGGLVLISVVGASHVRLWGQGAESVDTELLLSDGPNRFVFQVQLGGQTVARYTECVGLGSRNDIETDLIEDDAGVIVRQKHPGVLEWPEIVLRGSNLSGATLWTWRGSLEAGYLDQAIEDGVIEVIDTGSLETVARWEFHNGWAASLTFGSAGEELVIVHDGLRRADEHIPLPR